ncbi:phage portal protein [Azohydromonas aeria]|uniref:phage portal protein n=1 Tax=Azohydromonas aeria TaxID=2590212 RepID=UPI0012FCEBEE|nr:phage portal protein [Azohydromonas aeria]
MSFFGKLLAPRERQAQAWGGEGFWESFGFGGRAKSGMAVTVDRALQVTVVLACLRVIAEGVAQVPFAIHRKRKGEAGGSDVADDHPLHWLLSRRPNPWQTSFEFFEQVVFHTALCGRFIAFKNVVRGQVRELIPFLPNEVQVEQDEFRRLTYRVTSRNGEYAVLSADQVWHVKGPAWDLKDGLQILNLAREAIGLSIAAEESHAVMHANGGQTSGVYSIEGTLNKDQYKTLRDWIATQVTGDNRFRPFVLDRGAKYTPTTMTGVDQQHLEVRRHQVEEICRAFRCAPLMVGYSDKTATYASAEQMFLAHVVHCLAPWYRRLEMSIDVNLLTDAEMRSGLYAKFNPNGLMRGAHKDRADFYRSLFDMGAINPNEIRALEEMNPYDGGDTYRVQLNLTDASKPTPDPVPGASGLQQPAAEPASAPAEE